MRRLTDDERFALHERITALAQLEGRLADSKVGANHWMLDALLDNDIVEAGRRALASKEARIALTFVDAARNILIRDITAALEMFNEPVV